MDHYETIRAEAEKVLKPLADQVAARVKQLADNRQRLADEQERATAGERDITALKAAAAESLTGDVNAYARFKTSLKKRTAELETSQEVLEAFKTTILPRSINQLEAARESFRAGVRDLAKASRGFCESRIAALISQALAERRLFMEAFEKVFLAFGGSPDAWPGLYNFCLPEPKHLAAVPGRPELMQVTELVARFVDVPPEQRAPEQPLKPPDPVQQPVQASEESGENVIPDAQRHDLPPSRPAGRPGEENASCAG